MNDDTNQRAREEAVEAAFEALAGEGVDPFSMPETWDHAQVIADAVIAAFATSEREEALREAERELRMVAVMNVDQAPDFQDGISHALSRILSLITGGGEREE